MTLLHKTLETQPPDGRTHWTCRSMAAATGVSQSTVQRLWTAFHPGPIGRSTSNSPPTPSSSRRSATSSALPQPARPCPGPVRRREEPVPGPGRTQPLLPLGLGHVEGVTHGCIRHGTTTLFAALDVATGRVLAQCRPRHRHQEFLGFLQHIDAHVPPDLDIHLVVDNHATHKHARVQRWLADRPRYHIHFTPTYASWLNQVGIRFHLITQKAIRRGSFASVTQLKEKILRFTDHYNPKAQPFVWTATADSILHKIQRLCMYISGTEH